MITKPKLWKMFKCAMLIIVLPVMLIETFCKEVSFMFKAASFRRSFAKAWREYVSYWDED